MKFVRGKKLETGDWRGEGPTGSHPLLGEGGIREGGTENGQAGRQQSEQTKSLRESSKVNKLMRGKGLRVSRFRTCPNENSKLKKP